LRVVAEPGAVPVIAPVEEFRVSGLILPETIDQVIGAVPVAVRVWEYAVPAVAALRLVVVMVGAIPPPMGVLGAPKVGPDGPLSLENN
jgi:hypothetical protein